MSYGVHEIYGEVVKRLKAMGLEKAHDEEFVTLGHETIESVREECFRDYSVGAEVYVIELLVDMDKLIWIEGNLCHTTYLISPTKSRDGSSLIKSHEEAVKHDIDMWEDAAKDTLKQMRDDE